MLFLKSLSKIILDYAMTPENLHDFSTRWLSDPGIAIPKILIECCLRPKIDEANRSRVLSDQDKATGILEYTPNSRLMSVELPPHRLKSCCVGTFTDLAGATVFR